MNLDMKKLPDDPEKLKILLVETISRHEKQLKEERFKYKILDEQFKILQHKFFSRRSEKLTQEDKDQMRLFNEAEFGRDEEEPEHDPDKEEFIVKTHTRRKRGRKPLSDSLPREEVIHDFSDEEKKCPCCGKMRPNIGSDITEELDIVPAKIKVLRHIRMKYGPCGCGEFLEKEMPEVKTAPCPARIIPHSIVSPGLLAYVIVSKYADALPLYRQSKMFKRIEVDLSRATLCNWVIKAAEKCKDLISLMREEVKSGPLIQMDETTVQVLKEHGRDPTGKSYMWVSIGYPEENKPIILFDYHMTRSKSIPLKMLKEYNGYLQTDGYSGYNSVGIQPGIIHVGCFAHARRYFHDAFKLSKKSNTAKRGLSYIRKLYKVENELREKNLSPNEFVEHRKKQAIPILEEFHSWLQSKKDIIPPESKAGKAIVYTLNEWNKLIRYLDAHFLRPDNNAVEQAVRPFVIGRKNWLFSYTPRGAESSAIMYSLIETAKANNLEPYYYLRYLFSQLPQVSSRDDLIKLTPARIQADLPSLG